MPSNELLLLILSLQIAIPVVLLIFILIKLKYKKHSTSHITNRLFEIFSSLFAFSCVAWNIVFLLQTSCTPRHCENFVNRFLQTSCIPLHCSNFCSSLLAAIVYTLVLNEINFTHFFLATILHINVLCKMLCKLLAHLYIVLTCC